MSGLPGGATIGILGAGQLARMLALAAARLGLRVAVYDPAPDPPAAVVAARHVRAAYEDAAALDAFAAGIDVVTCEFENVPAEALQRLEAVLPVRPGPKAFAVAQDRLLEKDFLSGLGIATAPYAAIAAGADPQALVAAMARTGRPAILKTRRFGYDGRGQARVTEDGEAAAALAGIDGAAAILEGEVAFRCEISVIAARGMDGRIATYEPAENQHREGILRVSRVPAAITPGERDLAIQVAVSVLSTLDYVGVMGVEFFVGWDGLVVNEIAPRVHNSGHWTQSGCVIDQFEQHIRAVAGWPLGDGARHSDVEMENLIGAEVADAAALAADPTAALHLYGKREVRPGRKMGHVNRLLGPTANLGG